MARVGYKYYIVVNNSTGRIDNDCVQCRLVRSSTSQPTPVTDANHEMLDISKTDFNLMLEIDYQLDYQLDNETSNETSNQLENIDNRRFKNKWDLEQGKPVEDVVEDVAEDDVAEDEN